MFSQASSKVSAARALFSARFLKFAFVGASGVLVNLGMFELCMRVLPLSAEPYGWRLLSSPLILGASLVAVLVSIFTNFLLNDAWTWADRQAAAAWHARLGRYTLAASLTVVIQLGCTASLSGLGVMPMLAQCAGIGAGVILNYAIQNHWTFKE